MKINKTALGVVTFIILLILAGYSAKSNAQDYVHIGVGRSIINSDLKVGEIGYEFNNWEIQATLLEPGDTKNGFQNKLEMFSISYLTVPKWGYKGVEPYFRLGASYNTGSTLVGKTNFKLGIGLDFNRVFRLEYVHHSSSGIHNPNTGIDYVAVSFQMPAPW
jgi:hypothetical protein